MSDKDESLRRQLEQARKEVQDAHRVIALLVKKSGGKVSLNVAELHRSVSHPRSRLVTRNHCK